ncbi:hypothetical protein CC78DRAFT_536603 [Lojkania enalia]|uniref:Protein prenylyltransferase n=1 Tax=Lojkania enalia TaxID=147567 RepID=A0A9P4N032_9PLEO|nr:hypothetical protein CC78DRAFT_536603 [Didymosphaeria enalia]
MEESHDSPVSMLNDRAYDALNNYFAKHEDDVIAIEVLPPALQPADGALILHEGLNLGVSKQTLALAYLKARMLFFKSRDDVATCQIALEASRVILLFDPEHITAANFRKRWILQNTESTTVKREFNFLNSILTSPLHRQSKSPTLWHHRLWLLNLLPLINPVETSAERFLVFARAEFEAVFKAGGHHPKNYYAWQYARRLLLKINNLFNDETCHVWEDSYKLFLANCTLQVQAWCLKHTSDISGWSFLLFLLPRIHSVHQRRQIVHEVLDFATKLRSEQESLWVFLRMALADVHILQSEREALVQRLRNHQEESYLTSTWESRLIQEVKWIDTNTSASTEMWSSKREMLSREDAPMNANTP